MVTIDETTAKIIMDGLDKLEEMLKEIKAQAECQDAVLTELGKHVVEHEQKIERLENEISCLQRRGGE